MSLCKWLLWFWGSGGHTIDEAEMGTVGTFRIDDGMNWQLHIKCAGSVETSRMYLLASFQLDAAHGLWNQCLCVKKGAKKGNCMLQKDVNGMQVGMLSTIPIKSICEGWCSIEYCIVEYFRTLYSQNLLFILFLWVQFRECMFFVAVVLIKIVVLHFCLGKPVIQMWAEH